MSNVAIIEHHTQADGLPKNADDILKMIQASHDEIHEYDSKIYDLQEQNLKARLSLKKYMEMLVDPEGTLQKLEDEAAESRAAYWKLLTDKSEKKALIDEREKGFYDMKPVVRDLLVMAPFMEEQLMCRVDDTQNWIVCQVTEKIYEAERRLFNKPDPVYDEEEGDTPEASVDD